MPDTEQLEAIADELGAIAGRFQREISLRIDAALADLRRIDAERELRLTNLERSVADRLAAVKDGRDGIDGAAGRDGIDGKDGRDGLDGAAGIPGADGAAGNDGTNGRDGLDGKDGSPGQDGAQGIPGLEGRPGDPGPQGEPGPAGRDGVDGSNGRDGADGKDGLSGVDGAAGKDGADGRDGADGQDGAQGERGADGKDGRDGAVGERGAAGDPGKLPAVRAWTEGVWYAGDVAARAGATYQAIRDTGQSPPHDDWILIAAAGSDGRSFAVRGTYAKGTEYAALNVVALNGASFVALRDGPGECPGPDWQLLAAQGKTGKPGERGLPGVKGDRGDPGPAVVRNEIDGDGLLTITNADGSTVTCDFYPLLSTIHRP